METGISELKGKTLVAVILSPEFDRIDFTTNTGEKYLMYHIQDCCETVLIEDVSGDLQDLVGSPILEAEESSNSDDPVIAGEYRPESYTWTYYKLGTIKGHVNIRWLGESNGYYSERVDFVRINE